MTLRGNLHFSLPGPVEGHGGIFCGITPPCAGALTFSNTVKSGLVSTEQGYTEERDPHSF